MLSGLGPIEWMGIATLGIYAVLLGAGGLVGFLKAGSKPSLIAGSISAVIALISLGISFYSRTGFRLGLLLAVAMTTVFAIRFRKSGKFMPSGMLGIASAVVAILMMITVFKKL